MLLRVIRFLCLWSYLPIWSGCLYWYEVLYLAFRFGSLRCFLCQFLLFICLFIFCFYALFLSVPIGPLIWTTFCYGFFMSSSSVNRAFLIVYSSDKSLYSSWISLIVLNFLPFNDNLWFLWLRWIEKSGSLLFLEALIATCSCFDKKFCLVTSFFNLLERSPLLFLEPLIAI